MDYWGRSEYRGELVQKQQKIHADAGTFTQARTIMQRWSNVNRCSHAKKED